MPEYTYRCSEGHERSIIESMFSDVEVICKCGEVMWRKPGMPGIIWGGLRPSQGEMSPIVQDMVDNEDKNRADYIRMKENHDHLKRR